MTVFEGAINTDAEGCIFHVLATSAAIAQRICDAYLAEVWASDVPEEVTVSVTELPVETC